MSVARNNDFVGVVAPACTVELLRPVELKTEFQRFRAGGALGWLLSFQAKTVLLPVETGRIGLAASAAVAIELDHQSDRRPGREPACYVLGQ